MAVKWTCSRELQEERPGPDMREECFEGREKYVQSPEVRGWSAGWRIRKEDSLTGGRVCNDAKELAWEGRPRKA